MARRRSLETLSIPELIAFRDEIQAALAVRIKAERSDLQERIEALTDIERGAGGEKRRVASRGHRGLKATPAGGAVRGASASAKPKRKVAPKYRGPNGETWTGRGLPPRWLAALEAAGRKRESFLIKS